MFKKSKTPVYQRFLAKPRKTSRKKRALAGLGGAVVAILAGAFVKDKDKERHQ